MSCRSLLRFGAAIAVGAVPTGLLVGCGRREPATPAKTEETAVRLTSIKGRVQVKRAGTVDWIDATLAFTLRKDDFVLTGKHATAEIRFADGTQFGVRPDSLITILESSHDTTSHEPRVGLGIQSGELNFQTPAQDGRRKIETPGGRTTPERETEGNIRVGADGKTGVSIFQGKGRVDARSGQQLLLGPKEGVEIDAEGKAGPKLPLPELPIPTSLPEPFNASPGVLSPPQLTLDAIELRETQLHVKGHAEPGVTVTVNGERIPVQGDGSFNEHVVLKRGATTVSVRATGVNGAVTEQQLPIVVPK